MPIIQKLARLASVALFSLWVLVSANAAWATATVSISPSTSYDGNYRVSWSGNDGGAGGNLYENGASITSIGSSSSGSYSVSGKPAGDYSYYIIYYDRFGGSTQSGSTTVTVLKPPAAPTSVSASQNGATISVSGFSVAQAATYNYKRIETIAGTTAFSGTTGSPSFSDPTIAFDTSYYYSVQACNLAGCSTAWANSNTISIPPVPKPPSTVTASLSGTLSNTSIVLSGFFSSGAASYTITRSPAFSPSASVSVGSPAYTDTTVAFGTTYSYQITADNTTGSSVAVGSNYLTVPPIPMAPASIWGTPAGSFVQVGWNSSTYATYYNLTNNVGLSTVINGVNNTLYADYAISPGQQIVYQVSACTSSGCSTPPVSSLNVNVPIAFYVTNNDNDGSYTLNWSGAKSFATLYDTSNWSKPLGLQYGPTSGSFQITGKTAGITSNYALENWSVPDHSDITKAVKLYSASLSVTLTQEPAPSITASLNANTGNGPSISVSRGTSPGNSVTYNTWRNGSPYTLPSGNIDTALVPNMNYTYSVNACNGTNCSVTTTSNTVFVVPLPGIPTNVAATVTAIGANVSLSWTASSGPVRRYELFKNGATSPFATSINRSFTDRNVVTGTPITYQVRAYNDSGWSALTPAVAVTVPPIPKTPATIRVRGKVGGSLLVTWSASLTATSYSIKRSPAATLTQPDPSATAYSDTLVVKGTSYTYSVVACNSTGCSQPITSPAKLAGDVTAGSPVTLDYEYDTLGRLKTVTENQAQTPKTNYNYDPAGNRTTVTEQP